MLWRPWWRLFAVVLWSGIAYGQWLKEEIKYKPLSYGEIVALVESLEAEFQERCVTVTNILDRTTQFPWKEFKCYNDLRDADEKCVSPLIRLASLESGDSVPDDRPGVLLSGTVHGDERLGAVVVVELARLLAQLDKNHNYYAKWLLANRDIWILPFANAYGYARNERGESNIDPNRDFPYINSQCFQTNTAAIIDYVIHQKIFLAGITFHGGMRSLTYAWGSPNHAILNGVKEISREAPDHAAHISIARAMQMAAGAIPVIPGKQLPPNSYLAPAQLMQSVDAKESVPNQLRSQMDPWNKTNGVPLNFFYPVAATTDLVYSVKGGLEDWSYGGGWESSPYPIGTCARSRIPTPPSESNAADPHLNFLFFLAEADDEKNPSEVTYGSSQEIRSPSPVNGHIPRNIVMALKLIEMLRPELIFFIEIVSPTNTMVPNQIYRVPVTNFDTINVVLKLWLDTNGVFEVQPYAQEQKLKLVFLPVGCSELNHLEVSVASHIVFVQNTTISCTSLTGWDNQVVESIETVITIPPLVGGLLQLRAVFDQSWAQQSSPDPPLPPQNHISRIRINENHYARGWFRGSIQGGKVHSFPRSKFVTKAPLPDLDKNDTTKIAARVDLPITLADFLPPRQRLKRQNQVSGLSLICTGQKRAGVTSGSICGLKCIDCSHLKQITGDNITLKLYETRSYWQSPKKDPRKRLQNRLELATIPLETRNYTLKIPEAVHFLKGRLLQVVHQEGDTTRVLSQDVFRVTQWQPNATNESTDPFSHGLMDRYTMICLFPPGPSLNFKSPARDRYRARLMESFPEGVTGAVPADHLMASMGYFLITTSGTERNVNGHLCAPGLPTDRPAHIQATGPHCDVSFLAHTQPRTMLNPFASRVLVIKATLDTADVLSNPTVCRPGDEFIVKYELTPKQEVFHSCRLAWLRLGDRHEHDSERQNAEKEISRFLHDSICSRTVVMPPITAREFSWTQRGFLGLFYLSVLSLSLMNIPWCSYLGQRLRWKSQGNNQGLQKRRTRYRILGDMASARQSPSISHEHLDTGVVVHGNESMKSESPDPRQRKSLPISPTKYAQ